MSLREASRNMPKTQTPYTCNSKPYINRKTRLVNHNFQYTLIKDLELILVIPLKSKESMGYQGSKTYCSTGGVPKFCGHDLFFK